MFVVHQRQNILSITEDVLPIFLFQVCKIYCTSATSLQSHYRGTKHRKVNFFHMKCMCRLNYKSGALASSVLDFTQLQVLIQLIGRFVTVICLKYSKKKMRWESHSSALCSVQFESPATPKGQCVPVVKSAFELHGSLQVMKEFNFLFLDTVGKSIAVSARST